VLARRLRGEFGQIEPALRIEVLGTHPQAQGQGIGLALIDGVARYALDHGVPELRTQAAWTDYPMLGFLDRSGFTLADAQVVDLGMPGIAWQPIADDAATADEFGDGPALEIDYGKPAPDFDRLARDAVDIRSMTPEDLAGIVRIDRQLSGSQRAAFLRHALDETLADSAVRVSLTARFDGIIAGFLMARTDFGDYGRAEPVAVLDAIGVDPDFGHRGIAHALLSQLCVNATALGVERIESAVAYDALGLLGFLYSTGFAPSQRLAFVRRLA
jgi:ribosomal protein S18 acetylase RimI-like enzyme